MRMVIAIGGNALFPKNSSGTAKEQRAAAKKAIGTLCRIFRNHQVVITHGNGPQIGSLLLQQQSTEKVPRMPLAVLDAMTQGEIGYFIESALPENSAAIITRVLVDDKDPAFRNPTKPIGPFYRKKFSKNMISDAGRGYRLVVPSPKPKKILEKNAITALMKQGFIVVCGGGGGIPVNSKGEGLDAVIDKDRFSSLLATTIKADALVFITSVDSVYTEFGKKSQKPIRKTDSKEMRRLLKQGHFASGSMKPKIESALRFLEKGGKTVIICSIGNIGNAIRGKAGTFINV